MKSMTYAQKADLVAKCKRVFESVKRSNQVAMAEKYKHLALKAMGDDYQLCNDTRAAFTIMDDAIKNKPRYRYDSKAGEWVTTDEYLKREYCRRNQKALDAKIDAMRSEMSYKYEVEKRRTEVQREQAERYLSRMNSAISPGNTLSALANSYAEEQRQGNPFSNRLGINPNIMDTSCYQIGAGVNPLTGW